MFIEHLIDTSTSEQVDTWTRQASIVRAEILTTVKDVLNEMLAERNALYFEQTDEGVTTLTAVLTKELGERLGGDALNYN